MNKLILLVANQPAALKQIQGALQECGMCVDLSVVKDGVEAMALLQRKGKHADAPRPDLILLDLNLSGEDGREVLAVIKSDEKFKRIPVVILTVSAAVEDILGAYDLHANCYITKPIHLRQFVEIIKSVQNFWLTIVTLPSPQTPHG
jgi:chemotaxis family two-component system response regulator Rcp1